MVNNISKYKLIYKYLTKISLLIGVVILLITPQIALANPASQNYQLQDYSFGASGTDKTNSNNYGISAVAGQQEGGQAASNNFSIGPGLSYTVESNTPAPPTVSNPSNYYNQLKIVIDNGSNPTDATFAIAISTDDFLTDTRFVQADHTLGTSPVWQSYSSWSGATGFNIIGLDPGLTYTAKVTAIQGDFSQSPFSAITTPTCVCQAATISPTLSFDLDVAPTDQSTSPPYNLNIGTLIPGSVTTSSDKIWVSLSTNATGGGTVYVYSTNSGLNSSSVSHNIISTTTDLTGATEGYGAQSSSVTQSAGGPFETLAPYNGLSSSNNVGALDSTKRPIFDSSNSPVTAGRASFLLKAKPSTTAPAATDYTDVLTVIATGSF